MRLECDTLWLTLSLALSVWQPGFVLLWHVCNCNCDCHVAGSCRVTARKLKFICIFDLPVVINMHTESAQTEHEELSSWHLDLMRFFNEASS